MGKFSIIYNQLKAFEAKIKQKSILLFLLFYLIKTAVKYIIVIFLTTVIYFIIGFPAVLLEPLLIAYIILFILALILWVSPSIIYILLFSKDKITIHPFIVPYLFNIYTFNQCNLDQYLLVLILSLIGAAIVVFVQWAILKRRKTS